MSYARGAYRLALIIVVFFSFIFIFPSSSLAADWPPITDADRAFVSVPGNPTAPAAILQREQIDDNMNNQLNVYERVKILTDAGRQYATVEIPDTRLFGIEELKGRTVHPDGSIIPFAGKAEDQRLTRDGKQVSVKSFTLPDATIGSIIDFRYTLHYIDNRVFPPEWEVQTDLFQRKTYFKFIPLQNRGYASVQLDHGQIARNLAWTPFLGTDAKPVMHTLPSKTHATVHDVLLWIDLNLNDVPPVLREPFMPPASLLKWRVYFYYQVTLNPDEYWKNEGKFWNKDVERFLSRNDGVSEAAAKPVIQNDPPEQKIRKIYAYITQLKNKSGVSARRQKAYALEYRSPECIMESGISGLAASGVSGCVQSQNTPVEQARDDRGARDVLREGGGTHDDLNRLFVAMLRAEGVPASLIWVPDRSEQAFLKDYLSTDQLDAEFAVVQVDGKDVFLDPGTKFCPYGTIDWRYSSAMGLRQTATGAEIAETPSLDYKQSLITRKAELSLDEHGVATGTVSLFFKGVPAMVRRQAADGIDAANKGKLLEADLSGVLRGKSDVQLLNSPDWDGTDTPLIAQFRVKFASPVSNLGELSFPSHPLESGDKPWFPDSARTNAIDFHYPWQEADELRLTLPQGVQLQRLATDDALATGYAKYRVQNKQESATTFYSRRDFIMATGLLMPVQYGEVKSFFDKISADDSQATVLRVASTAAKN
jgi:hypothetical protein